MQQAITCTLSRAAARSLTVRRAVPEQLRRPGAGALPCRQLQLHPQASTQPGHDRPSLAKSSKDSCGPKSATAAAPLAAAAALLLPLVLPHAAGAAEGTADAVTATLLSLHSLGSLPASEKAYWACVGLGTAAVLTTLVCTSRFILSYFPELERTAKQRPSAGLLRALTAVDPVLDPITKGLFKMTERGDLNYGAMAMLAVLSAVMTTLLGDGGLMVDAVPDLGILQALRYLLYFQHMTLLPMWVFVVFRWFLLI